MAAMFGRIVTFDQIISHISKLSVPVVTTFFDKRIRPKTVVGYNCSRQPLEKESLDHTIESSKPFQNIKCRVDSHNVEFDKYLEDIRRNEPNFVRLKQVSSFICFFLILILNDIHQL